MTSKNNPIEEPIVEITETLSPEDEHVAELMSHTIDVSALASAVTKQKAADAADTLEDLDDDEAVVPGGEGCAAVVEQDEAVRAAGDPLQPVGPDVHAVEVD